MGGSRAECSARGRDGAHWGRRLDSDRAHCRLSVFVIQVDGTLLVVLPSAAPPPGIRAELGASPLVNRAEGRRGHFLEHYRHWFLSSSAFPRSRRRKSAAGSRAALRNSPRGKNDVSGHQPARSRGLPAAASHLPGPPPPGEPSLDADRPPPQPGHHRGHSPGTKDPTEPHGPDQRSREVRNVGRPLPPRARDYLLRSSGDEQNHERFHLTCSRSYYRHRAALHLFIGSNACLTLRNTFPQT